MSDADKYMCRHDGCEKVYSQKKFEEKNFIVRRAGVANHLRQNLIVTDTKQHVAGQKGR